jgi:hypothetical protein
MQGVTWFDDNARASGPITHTIAPAGAQTAFVIPSRKVFSAISSCEIGSRVEIQLPNELTTDGSQGRWVEWKKFSPHDDLTINMDQAAGGMHASWNPSQKVYLNTLRFLFSDFFANTAANMPVVEFIPPTLNLKVRFVFWDETNPTATEQIDEVDITLTSSQETLSKLCDFENLLTQTGNEISGTKTYKACPNDAQDCDRREFTIPSKLDTSALEPHCADLLRLNLEIFYNNDW